MALYVLFENKNTFLFLYFICLLLNLQMCQIILPDPVFEYPLDNKEISVAVYEHETTEYGYLQNKQKKLIFSKYTLKKYLIYWHSQYTVLLGTTWNLLLQLTIESLMKIRPIFIFTILYYFCIAVTTFIFVLFTHALR